jgi:HEAT repeat protein
MAETDKLKAILDALPGPNAQGTFADLDKDKVEWAIPEIAKGGAAFVVGLVERLVEPGKGDDVKAHYALHALAVHLSGLEDDKPRAEFARTVAAQLAGDRPPGVKQYLIQQLQVAGGAEAVAAIAPFLADESLCETAALVLVAIGQGAAEALRAALPKVPPACRLVIVQNLGAVRDAASVDALRQALADADAQVRLAAAWGLARLADPGAVEPLLKAADAEGWERFRATEACLTLAEGLLAAGKKAEATKVLTHLRDTRTDPAERHVREAAERALAAGS